MNAYRLTLPPSMKHLHRCFNIVKLMLAPTDRSLDDMHLAPPPELINREEEYVVEEIRGSRMFQRRLQYLVK